MAANKRKMQRESYQKNIRWAKNDNETEQELALATAMTSHKERQKIA